MDRHRTDAAEQTAWVWRVMTVACCGIFWALRSGAPWRDLPETYGPHHLLQSLRSVAAAEIPGIGPIVATALVAEIGDWKAFASGRNLAAWIGLVPKQHTTGGKDRLGGITKQGNRYLRWLLVVGATAVIRYAQKHGTKNRPWLGRLMERRPTRVGSGGACQQDRTDSLGHHGSRRQIQRAEAVDGGMTDASG